MKYIDDYYANYYWIDYSGENRLGGVNRKVYVAEWDNEGYYVTGEEGEYSDLADNFKESNKVISLDTDFIISNMNS